ncbi:hypothetical protein MANES_09G181400v8 [Manihot esculenta]|uniref:Uncharacterized protein n=1 Tax=Manihot esculenta TaxID=3983 RepID=A0A2C9VBW8_MANES|nr:hypothetical protein MANES_09G181400v8 [Manihot esculenta]
MGGNSRKTKKSISFFSLFKFRKSSGRIENSCEDVADMKRRPYTSDEDGKGPWKVADPLINTKTSAFLAHVHETCISEAGCQVTHLRSS